MAAQRSRREKYVGEISPSTRILEVGALHRPTFQANEANIRFADFASCEELKRLYSKYPGFDIDAIVNVDFVITNNDYRNSVGDNRFDLILASHVGEHMPSLLDWIDQMAGILEDGGVLSLILPDKRYTFDLLREPTTTAELISNYKVGLTKPSPIQIYEHVRNHLPLNGVNPWYVDGANSFKRIHSDAEAWNLASSFYSTGEYYDSHCTILTPKSFFESLSRLADMGILPLEIEAFEDTAEGAIDFFVRLRKAKAAAPKIDKVDFRDAPYTISRPNELDVIISPLSKACPAIDESIVR